MSINIPDMNPIRFRNTDNDPDYSSIWPNYRNITQRVNNIPGMYATEYYRDHVVNRPLYLQFETTTSYTNRINVYKYNTSVEAYQFEQYINGTDITPTGWTGGDIYKYTFTPSSSGIYMMTFPDADLTSDEFYVHDSVILKKYLIQISFYNTENDYGMVFYDETTLNFSGLTYFTGILKNTQPGNVTSAYTNDRGGQEVLKKTPMHGAILTLTNVHHTYIENINMIFSCDRITVNGVEYSSKESPEVEEIDKSDLVNIKINLIKRTTSYYAEA